MLSARCVCLANNGSEDLGKFVVVQQRVGEGPRRSSCDLNNFQMEKEMLEEEEEEEERY